MNGGQQPNISKTHVAIRDYAYHPADITVARGTEIIWINEDTVEHSVTSDADLFDGEMEAGKSWSRVFDEEGTYPYYCRYHPQMHGTIRVE